MTFTRGIVDRFLDPGAPNWSLPDPELGYRLQDTLLKYGLDQTYAIFRYEPDGARKMVNFAEQPCRINTYGDSYTQGCQVNDGETWQEILAAHFGEPIRNFGVGGYGVYQAYRRMLREESLDSSVRNILLNIYSADHVRNVYSWRWLTYTDSRRGGIKEVSDALGSWVLECAPWAHLRLNLQSGSFDEIENRYSTPESLYLLCDEEHVLENFKNDLWVQVVLAQKHATDTNIGLLRQVADALDIPDDFSTAEATASSASTVFQACALRSTMFAVDRARDLAERQNKKLMVLLSYSAEDIVRASKGAPRPDAALVDHLEAEGIDYVDTLERHLKDYQSFSCSPEEYADRLYIGHYNPSGNHFFAFAIKDAVMSWLDPAPPTYQTDKGAAALVLASNSRGP
jgi:hypothetical protein